MVRERDVTIATMKKLYVHQKRLRGAHKSRKIKCLRTIAEEDFEGEDDDFDGSWLGGRRDQQLYIKIKSAILFNSLDSGEHILS